MNKKRIRAAFVLACLVLVLVTLLPVQAASIPTLLKNYRWVGSNEAGFGDPTNVSVSALEVYRNHLYAGTINWKKGGSIWRHVDGKKWEQITPPGVVSKAVENPAITDLFVYNDMLYAGTSWGTTSKIMRYNGSKWEEVYAEPGNGFTTFEFFNDQLYVGSAFTEESGQGAKIYKSATGAAETWTPSVIGGNRNANSFAVTNLKVFGKHLYAAVANRVNGAQVWRTMDGITWETVVSDGFESSANFDPGGFTEFNGYLYLGVRNEDKDGKSTGGKIFRTQDGDHWQAVTQNGFNNVKNVKIEGITVFEDTLFATTYNYETGLEVWASVDGTAWEPVRRGGFYSNANTNSLWNSAAVVHNGNLFVGTSNYNPNNGGEVWRFSQLPYHLMLPSVFR